MTPTATRTARGQIVIVQEQRFRLRTGDGQTLLLVLSKDADRSPEDVARFHRNQTPVVVEYEGEPNLESAAARSVRPA